MGQRPLIQGEPLVRPSPVAVAEDRLDRLAMRGGGDVGVEAQRRALVDVGERRGQLEHGVVAPHCHGVEAGCDERDLAHRLVGLVAGREGDLGGGRVEVADAAVAVHQPQAQVDAGFAERRGKRFGGHGDGDCEAGEGGDC